MRFITFTDVHASAVNPESREGDYQGDILDKLSQIGQVGRKLNVDFYLLAGDLFNLKYPTKNPHSLNRSLIEIFSGFGAPVFATEGNHDLRNDSYQTFDEQPLSVLYASGALRQLREQTLTSGGLTVRLRGFPFEERPKLGTMRRSEDEADYSVSVLHLYSSPAGGDLRGTKIYSYEEISQLGDDMYVMGHYHIDQGITEVTYGGKTATFINVGAVSRGSLVDDNLSRAPKFAYVEVLKKDGKVEVDARAVKLRVKPSSEIFNVEAKIEQKRRIEEASAFVEKLRSEDSEQQGEDRIESELSGLKIGPDVLGSVQHYLAEADMALKGAQ
jgi:3',5'-cyclic AMP phosphodiesterase CpdA